MHLLPDIVVCVEGHNGTQGASCWQMSLVRGDVGKKICHIGRASHDASEKPVHAIARSVWKVFFYVQGSYNAVTAVLACICYVRTSLHGTKQIFGRADAA